MKESTGRLVLALTGLVLVLGFFMPWVDLGLGAFGASFRLSGYQAIQATPGWTSGDLTMAFVPLAGFAMIAVSLLSAQSLRRVSMGAGALILLYPLYKAVQAFFQITGYGLWLVFAAALAAIVVPLATRWETRSR